jgi:hypothetical protein
MKSILKIYSAKLSANSLDAGKVVPDKAEKIY